MNLQEFRESINLKIYNSKETVLKSFRVMSVIVAFLAVASMVYFHGFNVDKATEQALLLVLKWSFAFYILKYLVRLLFSFSPIKDIKESIFEVALMFIILVNFFVKFFFGLELIHELGILLNLDNLRGFFIFVIQIYFVIILLNEVGRAGNLITTLNLSPSGLLISSFVLLIAIGTGFLMLPNATSSGISMPFFDALFTSISASCVTGLIVVDTATYFSMKGQLIIMMLIQLGGLNIISFAAIFAIFARKGIGLRHQHILKENLNAESLGSSSMLFKQIFVFSLIIEAIGAVLIYFTWGNGIPFDNFGDKLFHSVFHSISAFNNAGFSIFTDSLFESGVSDNYSVHLVIAVLIVMGGLGFSVLRDLFSLRKNRERINQPWKSLRIDTKLALYSAGILIISGFIVFWLFERNNTLADKGIFGQIVSSLFQSITARTAGFHTVDISTVTVPVLIFLIFLMFIGASPGSTGGGIKTNTFALIILGAFSTARGKDRIEIYRSTIPFDLLNKAILIFLFSIAFISMGIFGLAITEPDKDLLAISFEEVSAYCTVGLSTGITTELSFNGRIIIMLSMFLGRIGPLAMAFAIGKKKRTSEYKYPKANIIVG